MGNVWLFFYRQGGNNMILKEVPVWDRPREKALNEGIKSLSNAELIAILLRTGVKEQSVLSLSQAILAKLNQMNDLSEITINELCSIKGIGPAKAITVLAGIELGLRILKFAPEKIKLNTPQRVFNLLKDELKPLKQETLIALYLNVKGELIIKKTLFVGTVNLIVIDAKEIFKWAYKHSASAIILVHNHPSGDPTPSQQDLQMTKVLLQQADALGFVIIDHIVIGDRFFSMKQQTNLFNR